MESGPGGVLNEPYSANRSQARQGLCTSARPHAQLPSRAALTALYVWLEYSTWWPELIALFSLQCCTHCLSRPPSTIWWQLAALSVQSPALPRPRAAAPRPPSGSQDCAQRSCQRGHSGQPLLPQLPRRGRGNQSVLGIKNPGPSQLSPGQARAPG